MAKICVISGDYPPKARGTGYSAYKIAKYLKKRYNHEIIVITRTMVQSDEIDVVNEIIKPFFQRDYCQIGQIGKIYRLVVPKIPLFQIFINHIKIAKIIRLERPAIAIIVTPGIYSIPKMNIPYIIKNGGSIFVYNAHRHFDSPYSAYIKIFGTMLYRLEKKMFSKAKKVISVSSFESKILNKVYGIEQEKLGHVLNGIDRIVPNPPILIRKKIQHIVYVGQLNEIKGIKYLLGGFAQIAGKYPDLTLDVVGEGSFRQELERFIQTKGLERRVFLRGYLPQKELQKYYIQSDLAVVPSLHDACPNTVLEALGYAIPVIGSRVGGIPELITQKRTGLLFRSKDPNAIANAISELVNNTDLYASIIQNIINTRESMSWFQRIAGINEVIQKLIGGK